MPRDAVSRTANVERNGGQKWVKRLHFDILIQSPHYCQLQRVSEAINGPDPNQINGPSLQFHSSAWLDIPANIYIYNGFEFVQF